MLPYREYDVWSRWSLLTFGIAPPVNSGYPVAMYYIEVFRPRLKEGAQTATIVDVTAIAPQLLLIDGKINADGTLHWLGGGEVTALIDYSAKTALIRLIDGSDVSVPWEEVEVVVRFPRLNKKRYRKG